MCILSIIPSVRDISKDHTSSLERATCCWDHLDSICLKLVKTSIYKFEILTGGYWDLRVSQPPMKSPICETIRNSLMFILEHEFNFNLIVFYWPALKLIQLIGISRLPQWFNDKESTYSAGNPGLITGSARSPGGEYGNPLPCSFLESPIDREVW